MKNSPSITARVPLAPRLSVLAAATLLAGLAAGCSSMSSPMGSGSTWSQAALPDPVKVPDGHRVAMETVGVGQITYECREKQAMAGQYEWVFVGPDAALKARGGQTVGRYWGPPATWENNDGSKLTGTQVAVAPAGSGNIPYQLVKANPAMGQGAMTGVSYIQRAATRGGVAPAMPCAADSRGRKEIVTYQADYIFWKPI